MINTKQGICEVAKKYFEDLFSNDRGEDMQNLNYVKAVFTNEDNLKLIAPFQVSEFKNALVSMHSDKAPGPAGLSSAFFKRFWHLCGVEIFQPGVSWLNSGSFPNQIMATNIVLIQKKDKLESMRDLRSISLYNVLYNIIAKVLANQMKLLLDKCISQEQSAFVENRLTTDNVMTASEILHHMKCKRKGNMGEVALKVDISKAYDRVN